MKKKKIGLALGAGSAYGLSHIGVLKTLHKHKIYPDYIAGTSMGAVIGAAYAAGRSPKEIQNLAKSTDWKKIVDFTIPKKGLIKGTLAEKKIRKFLFNKNFENLPIPLSIVAYNLTLRERVVFKKGDIARAVRASISIPGIFAPVQIGANSFIDGAVTDPTPFDIVKEMGADIVIAVDLSSREKSMIAPKVKKQSLYSTLKKKFVVEEINQIKGLIFPEAWPKIIRNILIKIFDKIIYPARILRMMVGKELFPVTKILNQTINILMNNLAREKIKNAEIDVIISPSFGHLQWSDFDQVNKFVRIGEKAMEKEIKLLRRRLR